MQTSFEDLAVFFAVFLCFGVERNWSLIVNHVVVEPLSRSQIAERVSKEIFFAVTVVGVSVMVRGGRSTSRKHRTYDYTKGCQGEDTLQQSTSCK